MDLSAKNLHLLAADHWLVDPQKVKVLRLTTDAWVGAGAAAAPAPLLPTQTMRRWRATDVRTFLKPHDLGGFGAVLFANGLAGNDFGNVDVTTLTNGIRLSIFTARKVLAARDTFLCRAWAEIEPQRFFSAMHSMCSCSTFFRVGLFMHTCSMTVFVCFRWPVKRGFASHSAVYVFHDVASNQPLMRTTSLFQ